jgi:1,4-alpha-glucan branching enzyme
MKHVASGKFSSPTGFHGFQKSAHKPSPLGRQTVHFELINSDAQKVSVAGTFNSWKPEAGRMLKQESGRWVTDLTLKPGTYEYRFVVDGRWEADPKADHAVMNPFGERNSLLTVSSNDKDYP